MAQVIRVLVCGACGNMGREVVKAVSSESDLKLVGAVDPLEIGKDAGEIAGIGSAGVLVSEDLNHAIVISKPDIIVDFTHPKSVMKNLQTALSNKVRCVVGTTGISAEQLQEIKELCDKFKTPAVICPNFSTGAVLLMKFAREAVKFFPGVEIIELHHDKKADAPSGTAIRTAQLMGKNRQKATGNRQKEEEVVPGVRGGKVENIPVHSVRLPGLLAHQEVIFGGQGQVLTLRHDSTSRESFMPGILLAIRKSKELKGLVVGLENLL